MYSQIGTIAESCLRSTAKSGSQAAECPKKSKGTIQEYNYSCKCPVSLASPLLLAALRLWPCGESGPEEESCRKARTIENEEHGGSASIVNTKYLLTPCIKDLSAIMPAKVYYS